MRNHVAVMLRQQMALSGEPVTYTPAGGGASTSLTALVGTRDVLAEMGQIDTAQDVLRFEFLRTDFDTAGLAAPKRGATVVYAGNSYRCPEPPTTDDLGLLWQFHAAR